MTRKGPSSQRPSFARSRKIPPGTATSLMLLFIMGSSIALPTTGAEAGSIMGAFRSRLRESLQALQFPDEAAGACLGCRRTLLYTGNYYEGFGCAVHQLGLAQLVALATNRTLVVLDKDIWGYVSAKHCPARNWNCVFKQLGGCSEAQVSVCNGKHSPVIDGGQDLDTMAGPSRIVSFRPRGASSKHGSVHRQMFSEQGPLRDWIRQAGGVFPLRSEIQLWLWSMAPALKARIRDRVAKVVGARGVGDGKGYIAVHVRASDNLENTERDFGITRASYGVPAWGRRLLELADWLRQSNGAHRSLPGGGPVPVFVATDNEGVIRDLKRWHEGHPEASRKVSLIFDRDSTERAAAKDVVLHRKNRKDKVPAKQVQGLTEDILTTIELLASAQALLGSQISNVFRLAAELHCAQKLYGTCGELAGGRDGNLTSTGSVWTMDVPWYQDP